MIFQEKMHDFRDDGVFFGEKMHDFRVKRWILEEKMGDLGVKWGNSQRKYMIFKIMGYF